jgi:protein-arginine kinase activator protein McsA
MKYKKLTKEQLKEYENKKLTTKNIIEMEQRGFKIPLIVQLHNLEKEDKIEFTEDRVKDMLKFAIEREYYEKAAILRDFIKSKNTT